MWPKRSRRGVLDEDVKVSTELTGGKLGNVVVDATGSVRSMNVAYNFVGFTGRLWVGITQDELHFTQPLMHRREMTFLASRNAQRTSSPGSFDSSRQECSIRGSGSRTARPSRNGRRVRQLAEARDRRREGDGGGDLKATTCRRSVLQL